MKFYEYGSQSLVWINKDHIICIREEINLNESDCIFDNPIDGMTYLTTVKVVTNYRTFHVYGSIQELNRELNE